MIFFIKMQHQSFMTIGYQKKTLRSEKFLREMDTIVPWDQFAAEIEPYYREKTTGRKRKDLLIMLKIYFLQQWNNLSDPAAEDAIRDRISFQKFLGIDLMSDEIPDETTILNFRHLLEEHNLQKRFFSIVEELLREKGLLLATGTIVDATILTAPSSTKNKEKKRDPEMSSSQKNGKWFFGMKAHIGVDMQSGLVHSFEATTAKVHDKKVMNKLLHGKEKAIGGDKAYQDDEDKKEARKQGVFWFVLDKGKSHHPLSSSQKKRNKKHSSVRSKVEFPFHTVKTLWRHAKVRYRGIRKNALQFSVLFALSNLYSARKKLLIPCPC
jgi:IS5 family transposase